MACPYKSYTNLPQSVTSWLDGKHVVFGEVMSGYEIVEAIENCDKGPGDKPKVKITIQKSGELEVPEEGIHVDREL